VINKIFSGQNYQLTSNKEINNTSFCSRKKENKVLDAFYKQPFTPETVPRNSSDIIKFYKLQEQITNIFKKLGNENTKKINDFVLNNKSVSKTELHNLLTEISKDLEPEEKEVLENIVSKASENVSKLSNSQKTVIKNLLKETNEEKTNNKGKSNNINSVGAGLILLYLAKAANLGAIGFIPGYLAGSLIGFGIFLAIEPLLSNFLYERKTAKEILLEYKEGSKEILL